MDNPFLLLNLNGHEREGTAEDPLQAFGKGIYDSE